MVIEDCYVCDGRGCGACRGSGVQPLMPEQVVKIMKNVSEVLQSTDATIDIVDASIIVEKLKGSPHLILPEKGKSN